MAVAGAGLGLVVAPLTDVVNDAGAASGALSTFQQVGGALAIPIVGTGFFDSVSASHDLGSASRCRRVDRRRPRPLATVTSVLLPCVRPRYRSPHSRLIALDLHAAPALPRLGERHGLPT